jgi:hypothetical protein
MVGRRVASECCHAQRSTSSTRQNITMNPNSPLPPPLDALFDAINRNDSAGLLAFFGADGVVDDWGRRFVGPAAIKRWSDAEFIGQKVQLSVTRVEQRGVQVAVDTEVRSNGFNGPTPFRFALDNGSLREMKLRSGKPLTDFFLDLRRLVTPAKR